MDQDTIIAGLLHDVPEDTTYSLVDVEKNFGKEVAQLVAGITKLGVIKYRGIERYAENLRKMFISMAQDIRIVLIKMADRLHNLRTLEHLPAEKQQRIAQESLEIYAPIANRLGMGVIKGEIEDLAFPYVYPDEYAWMKKEVLPKIEIKMEYVEKVIELTKKEAGRIKDYISQPKPNGYQSLHTTVFCIDGKITEFQIRTKKMHEQAEYGIAAHWLYKENSKNKKIGGPGYTPPKKLKWVEDLVQWQRGVADSQQYLKSLTVDVFQNRIFVFTPKGDVIDLPENATPVDFAYHVHSWIGDHCSGAKINNQIVSLDRKLKNGDVIEIITDKKRKGPSRDWLKFATTAAAKSKIRSGAPRS